MTLESIQSIDTGVTYVVLHLSFDSCDRVQRGGMRAPYLQLPARLAQVRRLDHMRDCAKLDIDDEFDASVLYFVGSDGYYGRTTFSLDGDVAW